MSIKPIIKEYYAAWVANDRKKARSFVHDDLTFRSPTHNFDSADAMFNDCWQFARDFNRFEPVQEVYEADKAYYAYPVADMHVGEYVEVRDGKIAAVYVTFKVTV